MYKPYELHYLSDAFYKEYDPSKFPEIENKRERPYIVLLISIDNNTFAIPFRTNIRHKYCYKFKRTGRCSDSVTGLDFTKAVVINNQNFIGDFATIDNKEFVELSKKYYFIISKFRKYLDGYRLYKSGKLNEFEAKKYQYTTLKYFL